jgi:hypothetical protein
MKDPAGLRQRHIGRCSEYLHRILSIHPSASATLCEGNLVAQRDGLIGPSQQQGSAGAISFEGTKSKEILVGFGRLPVSTQCRRFSTASHLMSGCLELDIECPKQLLKMLRADARSANVCSD